MALYKVNTNTLAVTGPHSGQDLLGLASYGGSLYGIKTDGLVELTGANDESSNIAGVLKTGKLKFGSSDLKRSKRLYLEGSASKGLDVYVTTEEWGESITRGPYKVPPFAGSLRPKIVKIAGKPKTPYFQIQIQNIAGGTMKLRNMEMSVEVLDRKA